MTYIGGLSDNKMQYLQYESSSIGNAPEQLFYYRDGYSYTSDESQCDHYVGFYLKKHIFGIKSFFIKTSKNPKGSWNHPLTWKLIGSNDARNWNILDYHENASVLNDYFISVHFESQEYAIRHLRFVSTTRFSLRSIEFYGNLYPNNIILSSCCVNYPNSQLPSLGLIITVFILI